MGSWRHQLRRYFRASLYARLAPYLRPYRVSIVVVLVILVAQVGVGLVEPWSLQILVDNGLRGSPFPGWVYTVMPFLTNGAAIVVFAVVGAIIVRLFGNALELVGDFFKSRVNSGVTLRFQADLFQHLQRLSLSFHDQTSVGDSLYRLNNDTGFVSTLLWGNFRHLATAGLSLVGMVWIVMRLDWKLALIALSVAPFLYGGVHFYSKYFKEKSKRVKSMEGRSLSVLHEVLSCLRVVKAFGQEEREQLRFEDNAWAALRARLRLSVEQSLFSSGMGLVTKLSRSLVLLIGGLHVLSGQLSIGELLVIMAYVAQIHGPLETIGQTLSDMQLSMASAERVLEILDVEPEIRDRPGAKTLDRAAGMVAFDHVTFAYRPGQPVLQGISFRAEPGEVIAVVGPTGAGKTTLANLIVRFYDPALGRVCLDGHDLRDLTIRTLRDNIALVIQEPILFTGSIRDNIAYGRPDASTAEIEAAAKAANAHDFIAALPMGYDTNPGERGGRLSGGERQRVAIARAFLKNAPVLILDEPTSSVDSRTELVILEALDRLMVGRTTFIIAHRLSTIRRADHILVVEHGRIVEQGRHADLLEREGLYSQLYRIQTRGLRHGPEGVFA
jgi:ATP-binding cassette subfamily B protein/subfamily B ATP-binding cassette protein MsbA